jgi:hypothetical protein
VVAGGSTTGSGRGPGDDETATVPPSDPRDEAFWRQFLTRGDSTERRARHLFKRLPRGPRCRLCAAPFAGPGAAVMRVIGRQRSTQTPTMCRSCFTFVTTHHGGAEVECTMLFADIRGSTTLGESLSPGAFHAVLDRFYTVASDVVYDNDGMVDKFVGDELVACSFRSSAASATRRMAWRPHEPCCAPPVTGIPAARGCRLAPRSTRPRRGWGRWARARTSS